MGLSKETRIILFIAIDVAFFLLEIIVGALSPYTPREFQPLIYHTRLHCAFTRPRRRCIPHGAYAAVLGYLRASSDQYM